MNMNKLTTICIIVVMAFGVVTRASAQTEEEIRAIMAAMNEQLEAMGENVRIAAVEYYTAWEKVGQTVYFDDRALQMGSHWVPGDPRRGGFNDITWLSDQTEGENTANGVTLEGTQAAIDRAMATWDGVTCSTIPLTQLPDYGYDWGNVQSLLGFGGVPLPPPFLWLADITHAGWLPGAFFDEVFGPGGSNVVIGVTFTFVWIDLSTGEYTDIDNNRKLDVAFREIYYNNGFTWGINTDWPIDVETVVLHETGHGLSLDHFGKYLKTDKNGKFHFAPRAVMNAGYTGVQQGLRGTDLAGFCSIWGAWPYN